MVHISNDEFEALIEAALRSLPNEHTERIQNVAITWSEEPTDAQRRELKLRDDQTLFGLYEGVSLPRRQGNTSLLPDKITLFKTPLCTSAADITALKEQVRHTLWHEIAHYFGLDHDQIHNLE